MTRITARLISGEIVYTGSDFTALKIVISQQTPYRCRIRLLINSETYNNVSDLCKKFKCNDTIDITLVIIQGHYECHGRVVVDCRWGGPTLDTIATYSVEPCTNLLKSSNSFVCSRCRRITMNLCGKEPTPIYKPLIDRLKWDYDEEVEIIGEVREIFAAIDWVMSRMSYQSRIKYYKNTSKILRNNREYDFCKRNPPWW